MIKLYYLGLILLFSACSNNSNKIKELKAENQLLREKIQKMEIEIQNFQFSVLGVAKSDSLKLGEEYIATIGLVISNQKTPIKVELGKRIDNEFISDGYSLNKSFNEKKVYRYTPLKTGEHVFRGKVEFIFFNSKIERFFEMPYFVIN